ncbi:hypothetical protein ACFYOG_36315 [Streptomyces sp. NPDC007818]|uniref:hypothetical protein n=1 Tax=Streptomyces sp. NPDC007818 TaxID=3364780 RepID=UPI003684DAC2
MLGGVVQAAALLTAFFSVAAYLIDHVAFAGSTNDSPQATHAAMVLLSAFGLALLGAGVVAWRVGCGLCTAAGTILLTTTVLLIELLGLTPAGYVFPALFGLSVGMIAASGLLERSGWVGIGIGLVVSWTFGKAEHGLEGRVSSDAWVDLHAHHLLWILPILAALAIASALLQLFVRGGTRGVLGGVAELI